MVKAVILLCEILHLHPQDILDDAAHIHSLKPDAHIVDDNGEWLDLRIKPLDRVHDLVLPVVGDSNLTAFQTAQVLDSNAEL